MICADQRQWTSFDEQSQPVHESSLQPVITCFRGIIMALVLLLLVQTFLVEGLLTRLVVSGMSMSPTFHGTHFLLHCSQCATVFCVETDDDVRITPNQLPLRWGTCPTCAFSQVPVPADARRMGDRIVVNRAALSLRAIRRWDTVLFRLPEDGTLTVKRIVGLPGETVEIRDGDIFINGQIAVKPWTVQKAMRIPVLFGRWEMQPGKLPGTFEFAWHPIRTAPYALSLLQTEMAPGNPLYGVTNQLCENQWRIEPPNGIFPVRDLMLEFEWRPEASKRLCVRACSSDQSFDLLFDPVQKNVTVTLNGIQRSCYFSSGTKETHRIAISLFDRQLLVAVDGKEAKGNGKEESGETVNFLPPVPCLLSPRSPFAVSFPENAGQSAAEQEAAFARQITNLRVWRDAYYTHNSGNTQATCVTIPSGCYYVLGDNSSFSSDSRSWHNPFIAHRYLIGIVTAYSTPAH